MAWLDLDQPTPSVKFDSENDATVFLVVQGRRTPQWRADFNASARSAQIPVGAWWIEGQTVLQVAVTYQAGSYPSDIFQTLSDSVRMLDGGMPVSSPTVVETPAPSSDTRRTIGAAVETWWDNYRSLGRRQ